MWLRNAIEINPLTNIERTRSNSQQLFRIKSVAIGNYCSDDLPLEIRREPRDFWRCETEAVGFLVTHRRLFLRSINL